MAFTFIQEHALAPLVAVVSDSYWHDILHAVSSGVITWVVVQVIGWVAKRVRKK
jgi:hypothetical protein